ncbi:MAG TPA: VWA domain-containing protein, partial [Vicinamibacterales bacterium]|nr:VWA domain-containing protein [Vicinamibacterales bacterium]
MRLGAVPLTVLLAATLAAQQRSAPTFRSNVNAVTLDVRVVDDHGQFVPDLSKDDLLLFEDGVQQTLTAFDLVNIPVRADMRPSEGTAPVDADTASNDIAAEQRLYILVLDDLRTEPTRSASVKAQARDFIEHRFAEGDRAVVVTTSGRKGLVQEFTNNRQRLIEAIDKFEAGFDARVKCASDSGECACNDDRTSYHLLSGVAQWLLPVKGQRKSLLFFGEGDTVGGRPSDPPADIVDPLGAGDAELAAWRRNDPAAAASCAGVVEDRKEAAEYAARADMTVYPVDPRRNVDAELARIVDDTSSYYLLGYVPTNDKHDGTFRKIEVRAKRPGLKTTARSGYTAPNEAPKKKAPAGANPALTELMATPVATPGLTMAVTAPAFRGSKGKASVEVVVDVAGSDLTAASTGARGVGKLELIEAVADADGKVKASERGSLDMKLSAQTREAMADQGLRVMSRLDVPPGKYLLRVAGADGSGNSKGSVQYDLDVPDFSKEPITMSGLTLSLASETRQPTTGSDKEWPKRFDHAPTAHRTFRAGDELTVAGEA